MIQFEEAIEEFGPLTIRLRSDIGGGASTKMGRNLCVLALNAYYYLKLDIIIICILSIHLVCIFNG